MIRIRYENIGTVAAENAKVEVLLDDYMTLISASLPYNLAGDSLVFALGNINPDDAGYIDIVVNINCQDTEIGQTHCITALGYPNEPCFVPSNYAGSDVVVKGVCDNDEKVVLHLPIQGKATCRLLRIYSCRRRYNACTSDLSTRSKRIFGSGFGC